MVITVGGWSPSSEARPAVQPAQVQVAEGACVCRSELLARDAKGTARIAAEQAWLQLHLSMQLPVHIFRLGGGSLLTLLFLLIVSLLGPCVVRKLAALLLTGCPDYNMRQSCLLGAGIYGPGRSALTTAQQLVRPAATTIPA